MKKSISTFFLTLALVLMSVVGANAQVQWSEDFGSGCSSSGGVSTLTALGWDTAGYVSATYSSSSYTYHWRVNTGGAEGCCAYLNAYYYYTAEESLLSPSVAMPSTDDYMLSFKLKNTAAGGDLDVFVIAGGTTVYLEQHVQGVTDWTVKEYSLAAYRGQNIRIGFKGRNGGSTSYTYYIDDVEVKMAPSCQKPVSLAARGLSTNSANLSWTFQGTGFGDAPAKCYVNVIDTAGNVVKTDSTLNNVTSFDNYSISLTGLQPNTTYTATVKGDCRYNYGGFSESASVTFTTMLPAVNPPYEETFDALSALPVGSNYTGNVTLNTAQSYAYGATGKSLKMTITSANSAMFMTPLINLYADETEIEFQLKSANSGNNIKFTAGYMTDVTDIGTYTPIVQDSIYQTTDWKEVRFNTSEMVGYDHTSPIMIAIQILNGTSSSVYVDNLQAHVIPTCIRPENVTVSNVTANTAQVAWTTSNASNHIIRLQNLSDSTWMTFNATTSPYTITGLTQNTQYGNLTIQGICSAADSSTVKRTLVTFKTLCDVSPTAIFFEGAEGTTGNVLPDCWLTGLIQQGTGTSGYSYDVPFYTHGTSSNACAGVRGFQLRDQKPGTISYLSSQAMNFEQVGKYSFRYSIYRPSGTNYNGEGLKVYVTPTPGDTTNGVLVIPFVNRMAGNSPVGTSGCNTYEGIINYGGTGHITIVGVSQYGSSTYFDNLEVFLTPSCPKPGVISTSNVTSSSIDLSWNAGNTETQWLLSYSVTQAGQVVDSATVTVSNQPTYTINNFSPATTYSVTASVRALCQVGDTSEVVNMSAVSFTTACTTISIFPYRENFESMTVSTVPSCWSNAASTATASYPYYIWGVYSYSSNKSIRMYNFYVRAGNAVIDMPQMALPNVPMTWAFDYSHRASCDSLFAQVSTDGVNFTTLGSFGQTNSSTSSTDPGTFTNASIDLSAYQGQTVTLRYKTVADYNSGALWVDNIVIRAIPTCPDVDANPTQVDGTTATITLDTTMTTWQISLGNTPGDSIIDVTGASTYTLTGLTPTTLYRYFVRSVCDTNYGDWSQSHSFTTTKLCPDLTATISDVTATSALVTKDATISGNWQIAVDADTIIDVAGATYTLTGLTPGTTYTVRVRKDCGSGTYGDWSADYTVVTPALPATLPYVCGFEDVQENNRWTFVDGAGDNVFTIGTAAAAVYAGTQALYITNSRTTGAYNYSTSSASRSYAYRDIHFDSKGYQVNFKVKATGGESSYDFGRVFLTTAATTIPSGEGGSGGYSGVTFPTMVAAFDDGYTNGTYQMFNMSSCPASVRDENGWVTISYFLDMSTKAAGDYKLVVMWNDDTSAGTNPPIAIDNINIYELTCIPPSTVLTNAITSTSADLEIQQTDATQWEVLVHTSAIDIENLPDSPYYRQITTSDVVSLTDLTPNTDYYFTVRAICGANDTSDWRTPDMLHTQCAAVNIPLMEGFESTSSTKCWTNIGDGGSISRATSANTGSGSMLITATSAVSPELLTDSLANFMINGWARSSVDSARFSIGVMNDPNDVSSFEILTDVTIPTSGTWFEFTSYFNNLNDDDYEDFRYAKYVVIATGTNTIYFDDIIIDLTPTCPKPTEVSITNVLAHSFDIAFTDNTSGTASSWSVKVNGAAQTITTNPATITGLNAATAYTVEVAAICSATDMSYYTNAGTIKTTCDLVNAPYNEDFSTHAVGAAPDCWDNTASTANPLSAVFAVYSYNGNKMVRMNDWSAHAGSAILTSPIIILNQGGNYQFGFDYDCASTSITSPSVAISTDAGASWTTLANLTTGTSPTASGNDPTPGTFTRYTYNISSYAGNNVMFKFECTAAYGSGGLFIDNVFVKELLSCSDPDAPVASNVTASTADVTFTDTCATHTQWQYVAGVAGFDPSSATPTTITSTSFSLSGLQDDANITVYVRAYCGAGDTSNWVGGSFKTLCLPFTVSENVPFYDSFEGYSYGDNLNSSCYTISPSTGNISVVPSSDPSGYTYGNYYSHDGDYTNKALYATNASYSDPAGIYIQRPFHLEAGNAYEISAWVLPTSYGAQFSILAGFNGTVTTMDTLFTRTMSAAQIEYDDDWNYLYNEAYEKISTIFSPDSTADYVLSFNAMYAPSSYYLYVYFDELQVRQFTGCAPSQVSVDSIGTNSAVVTLADTDPTHSFQYVLNDTTLAATTVTSNHFTLNGLSAASTYTLYIRTLCDSTSYSEWISVQFSTACGHITTFPYVQDFESMSTGSSVPCWPISGTSSSVTANPSYIWGVYNYSGNNSIRLYNFYASSGTAIINLPTIELPTQPIELSFDYSHLASCGAAYVKISTNGGTTYSDLFTFNSPSISYSYTDPGTFDHALIDLSAYAGRDIDIQFSATANYGSGAIWIDNVTLSYVPECRGPQVAPTIAATTMTTLSAQASMAGKDTIEFAIAPYVANVTAAAIVDSVLSADGTAQFTGLTGNTSYAVWYRYHCDEGAISDWSPMAQGTTKATDCFDPQNLSGGIVDDHSATFTWGAAPSVTRYYYELRRGTTSSGALLDSGSTVTPQVAYTNLTATTNYFFRVVGYCSGDTTSWVSIAITTTRTPAPMPFICSFENASDASYWEMDHDTGTSNNEFAVGTATNNGGSSSIYVTNDGGDSWAYTINTSSRAFARVLVPMTAGNYLVSYDYSSKGESGYDYGRIFLYPAANPFGLYDNSTLKTINPTGNIDVAPQTVISGESAWQSKQSIVTIPADAMYYFQLNWANDGSMSNGTPLAVDNIRIEPISCMPLNSVVTLAINPTTAKFFATRNEAGMELQYGYSIFDNVDSIQWTSIVNSNLSDTLALRGLTPATNYYLYVRELCDSTNISSPTRVAFKTPSTANNIPFVCSFESNQAVTNMWTFANSAVNEFVIGSAAASAGSQSLYISNDGGSTNNYTNSSLSYCYAYVPLQFSDGTFDISYDWLCQGESSYYDYGRVFLVPSSFIPQGGVAAGVTNTGAPSGWISIDGGKSLNLQSSWQTVETTVSFTDSTIMNLLAYWYDDTSGGSSPAFTIDNIMVTKQTCPALKFDSIRVDTVSTNMFTVHYHNPNVGASTQWILFSDMTRLDTVASGIEPAGSNSFTATGLNASTNYYVTMYAICDTNDMSRPLNFSCRTECATITVYPYDEGFESFNAGYYNVLNGACWSVSPAEDATTSNYEHYAFVLTSTQYPQYVHSGNQALAVNHGYYYSGSQILALPEMDTLNGKTVSFSHMAYGTYSYYVQMSFGYINASSQFVNIQTFPRVDEWQDYSTNLTNLPATAHRLAFKFTGEDNYFLDDIHINKLVPGRTYNDTICFGAAYNAHGISIAAGRLAAGDTTFTKTVRGTAAGQADSITTVNIYVRPAIVNATYDTICQGATSYNKNGWNITNPTSRTYSQQFVAACGCDSTLSLILYVQPNQVTLFDSICEGDSYQFGSMNLTQTGQYKDTVASQWGCDIVRTLNLFVADTATHVYDQTCIGSTYTWEGTPYTQSGTYKKVTTNVLNCTLTKYLHLTMTPTDSTCNVSFCKGGSVQVADTIIQTAGTYTFTRVNPATQCNTTYHVTATENQPTPERVNDEACEGKLYYGYGVSGVIITKDTTITQNTRTADGKCDSVVIATVKLNKTSYGPTENKSIDAGDSYTWHDNTYTESGVYYYTTTDVNGCDSILKLVLTVGGVTPQAVEDVVMLNISLIPNPVNAGQTSFIYGNFTNVKSVEILNQFGQVIDTFVPQTYPIEVQGVNASGVYYVRVVTEDEKVAVEKLIVR